MPDLKSQLAEVKAKLAAFDDEALDPSDFAGVADTPNIAVGTKIERLFNLVRDNPGITREVLMEKAARQDIKGESAKKFLTDMVYHRGLIRIHSSVNGPAYYVTGPEYVRESAPRKTKKYIERLADKKPESVAAPAAPTAPQDLGVQELLNTIPIAKARALYDELKKIFGG
jgi:hypothetical protein